VECGAVQPWAAGRTAWAWRRTLKGTTGLVSSSRSRASSSGVRWMRRGQGCGWFNAYPLEAVQRASPQGRFPRPGPPCGGC
jgi:hypothetical protein